MRRLLLVLLILLVLPAAARADRAPTLEESLGIAERWAAKVAPGHVNHCARPTGRLQVVWISDLGLTDTGERARGRAPGWVLGADGIERWDATRCIAWLVPDGDGFQHCRELVHEELHYVLGPDHVGPLDPAYPWEPPCIIDEPVRVDLFRAILADLPAFRGPWRVSCTRNSRRMRCKALSDRARPRRYRASIAGAAYSMGREGRDGRFS